jgi:hypothetical protein
VSQSQSFDQYVAIGTGILCLLMAYLSGYVCWETWLLDLNA